MALLVQVTESPWPMVRTLGIKAKLVTVTVQLVTANAELRGEKVRAHDRNMSPVSFIIFIVCSGMGQIPGVGSTRRKLVPKKRDNLCRISRPRRGQRGEKAVGGI